MLALEVHLPAEFSNTKTPEQASQGLQYYCTWKLQAREFDQANLCKWTLKTRVENPWPKGIITLL